MLISYLILLLACMGASKLQQSWLDRMVAYHKKNFLEEFSRLPPLTVTVEKAPAGFVDSPKWNRESVLRLVMLVEVLDARQARQAIRRALSPSRRFDLPPGKNTFDLFPSWSKDHPNHFYYDDMVQYDEKMTNAPQDDVVTDDTVVYISNPVEARLPASRITVRLLRDIMETRAIGLRKMPSTPRPTYSWTTKSQNPDEAGKSAEPGGADNTAAGGVTEPSGQKSPKDGEQEGEKKETEKPAEGEQKKKEEEKKEEEKKEEEKKEEEKKEEEKKEEEKKED
ncbi:uncharacterized protein LOC133533096 [Cydia pomonella]|uniref:uncharacterized protein LOC133533096 n=1 Tax=Cydia pomonella TaxID=82600 RepID=UPI002ADE401C|nr:uncharacterized protein LOC133533096 [Cydia pomonella]